MELVLNNLDGDDLDHNDTMIQQFNINWSKRTIKGFKYHSSFN